MRNRSWPAVLVVAVVVGAAWGGQSIAEAQDAYTLDENWPRYPGDHVVRDGHRHRGGRRRGHLHDFPRHRPLGRAPAGDEPLQGQGHGRQVGQLGPVPGHVRRRSGVHRTALDVRRFPGVRLGRRPGGSHRS